MCISWMRREKDSSCQISYQYIFYTAKWSNTHKEATRDWEDLFPGINVFWFPLGHQATTTRERVLAIAATLRNQSPVLVAYIKTAVTFVCRRCDRNGKQKEKESTDHCGYCMHAGWGIIVEFLKTHIYDTVYVYWHFSIPNCLQTLLYSHRPHCL